jgi:hypothetical protein
MTTPSIQIISDIVPINNGTFPTHHSLYGAGGWHEVNAITDRDNIPASRRVAGMACSVVTTNQIFILGEDLSTWALIVLEGVEEAPLTGDLYARQNAAWTDITAIFDPGLYA